MPDLKDAFLWVLLAWVGLGLTWLLPKKIKLLKRVGCIDNGEILKIAKNGDDEAKRLKRLSTIYLLGGLVILLPLMFIGKYG